MKRLHEIVAATAYYGEIARKEDGQRSKWTWEDGVFLIDLLRGGKCYPELDVINFWNSYPPSPVYSLIPYGMLHPPI